MTCGRVANQFHKSLINAIGRLILAESGHWCFRVLRGRWRHVAAFQFELGAGADAML